MRFIAARMLGRRASAFSSRRRNIEQHQPDQHGEQPLPGNPGNRHQQTEDHQHETEEVLRERSRRAPRKHAVRVVRVVLGEIGRRQPHHDERSDGQCDGGRGEPDEKAEQQRAGRDGERHLDSIVY